MADILDTAKKAGNALLDAGENFHRNEMQANQRGRVTEFRVTSVTDQFGRDAWAVAKNGAIFNDAYENKSDAVSVAKGLADDVSPARVVIEYKNGNVQDTLTY